MSQDPPRKDLSKIEEIRSFITDMVDPPHMGNRYRISIDPEQEIVVRKTLLEETVLSLLIRNRSKSLVG